MEVHGFITFSTGTLFHKSGIAAFDLDAAACFLLDMFYVGTSVAYDLCPQVEAGDWLEIDRDALFGPFALQCLSFRCSRKISIDIPDQIHHAPPVRALVDGIVAHRPGWEVPVS